MGAHVSDPGCTKLAFVTSQASDGDLPGNGRFYKLAKKVPGEGDQRMETFPRARYIVRDTPQLPTSMNVLRYVDRR